MKREFKIQVDGASRGNPGALGIGVAIFKNDKLIKKISEAAGEGTNNEAEYLAAIRALKEALKLKANDVTLVTDSELLMKQIKGLYKVKAENLFQLYKKFMFFKNKFENFDIIWQSRDKNFIVDELAKNAIFPYKYEIKIVKTKKEHRCKKCRNLIKKGELSKIKNLWYVGQKIPKIERFHFQCSKQ